MAVLPLKKKAGKKAGKGAVYIGTSGFSYHEWIGTFYPQGIKGPGMLSYYASQLDTVEVNNTFYRLPSPEVIRGWQKSAGPGFRFTVKASQRITHRPDFGLTDGFFTTFLTRVALLKGNLGTVLFQFPPYFGDLSRALGFVQQLREAVPRVVKATPVVEVRNPKLLKAEFFEPLAAAGVALCLNDEYLDSAHWPEPGAVAYLRLRRDDYPPRELKDFALLLIKWSGQGKTCYVYFQHEGRSTELARALKKLI
jgi:uncharacterized protein YecE (DUF72 family)